MDFSVAFAFSMWSLLAGNARTAIFNTRSPCSRQIEPPHNSSSNRTAYASVTCIFDARNPEVESQRTFRNWPMTIAIRKNGQRYFSKSRTRRFPRCCSNMLIPFWTVALSAAVYSSTISCRRETAVHRPNALYYEKMFCLPLKATKIQPQTHSSSLHFRIVSHLHLK